MALWGMVPGSFVGMMPAGFLMRGSDRGQGSMRSISYREDAKEQAHQNYTKNSPHLLPFPILSKD